MDFFDVLTLIGAICLFLFGMQIMAQALERRAGSGLRSLLAKLTTNKMAGFLTGAGVTAVIQASGATTVMVVGFVNSGIMTLKQAINVIIGANVGTTITAWILSLTGISSDNFIISLFKPTSFTPVLALIGIIMLMACKDSKKKDTGTILLGFAVLMYGMTTMTSSVSGLADNTGFQNFMVAFDNPLFGVLAGAVITALLQSSSASVGILQALSSTGRVTYGMAVPIIMGMNIGTTITAIISAVGANKNAKRAAVVHVAFNVIGTVVWLTVFLIANSIFEFAFVSESANAFGIAIVHTAFNIACTALLLPASSLLEKLACRLVPDGKKEGPQIQTDLDERLMKTPPVAIAQCRRVTDTMADTAKRSLDNALEILDHWDADLAASIRHDEQLADHYEDELGTYIMKLSNEQLSHEDRKTCAEILHMIGDFERISDHATNILESAEEIREKQITFSDDAHREMAVLKSAVREILDLSVSAYKSDDVQTAKEVEPLEQVVDTLKDQLRSRHIYRLQHGVCSIEAGFVWTDLLTNLERVSDHCSNIAGCVIELRHSSLDLHDYLDGLKVGSPEFNDRYEYYANRYALIPSPLDSIKD